MKLHLVVFIYGFTAILGKLITLPAIQLVWYRMIIAAVGFYLFLRLKKTALTIDKKQLLTLLAIGTIVALHWITFFGAIKISNISVVLGCLATSTLFTSLLEPLFFRRKINTVEVLVGILIIVGLYLIFRFETRYTSGILVALLSAFLAALFTVLNKKMVAHQKASLISFYEMISGFTLITLYLLFFGWSQSSFAYPSPSDLFYLSVLGIICTAYAFAIQIDVMKHLSAYVVALTINLEPIYGIVMACFIFGETEKMSGGFYVGTLIILSAVMGYPLYRYSQKRKNRKEATLIQID